MRRRLHHVVDRTDKCTLYILTNSLKFCAEINVCGSELVLALVVFSELGELKKTKQVVYGIRFGIFFVLQAFTKNNFVFNKIRIGTPLHIVGHSFCHHVKFITKKKNAKNKYNSKNRN